MATDKKENEDVFENLESLTKPRDIAWSKPWGKFENEGDRVQGYIRDVFHRPEEGDFDEQRGFTLEQKDGEYINVGIKTLHFVMEKTDNLRLNDPLIIELTELRPAKTKGYSPTKILSFYGKNLEENKNEKTVKQLFEEDKSKGGSGGPEEKEETQADKDFNEVTGDTKEAAEEVPFEG